MSKRLIFAAVATAAVAGFASSASAGTGQPVTVTHDDNGTSVGTHYGNQPLVGVHVGNDGNVCFGMSYQIGHCTFDYVPPIVVVGP